MSEFLQKTRSGLEDMIHELCVSSTELAIKQRGGFPYIIQSAWNNNRKT
jgi:hypothetical protein